MDYNIFRELADSWGLVYLFAVFVGVIAMMFLPGAKEKAANAAQIPLKDDTYPIEDQNNE